MTKNKKKQEAQKGFTLVEVAIALIIISLLVGFASVAFSGLLRRGHEKNTFKDMEIIADAITVYAQKHMRVPCPADPGNAGPEPFGAERGSGANGDIFGQCNTVALAEGILPFATLGLPQRLARDRFGNFITYRASVTSALRPADAITFDINNWCMTRPYWYTDDNIYANPAKAAFCCGTWVGDQPPGTSIGTSGDVIIEGSFAPLPNLSRNNRDFFGGDEDEEYISTDTTVDAVPSYDKLLGTGIAGYVAGTSSTSPPRFPAYILISHGENGLGAFTGNGAGRIAIPAGADFDAERENADGDVTFYTSDRLASQSPGGAGQDLFRPNIDDIIFWQTPTQIMGRIGGVSCIHP